MQTIAFAIKMEADAAGYYQKQATAFKDYPIARAFEKLVEAELKHQELLQNLENKGDMESELKNLSRQKNVFSNLLDFKNDIALIPRQIDVYQKALDLEQQSIQLYSKLIKKTQNESERGLLQFLIDEEKKHYVLFEELVELVKRPVDWVEDAEFGDREQY